MFGALIVVCVGLVLAMSVRHFFYASLRRSLALYSWHTLFSIFYIAYIVNFGGDATMYYVNSLDSDLHFSFGTHAVIFFTSFLSDGFGLSFVGCSLFFQMFGFIGLMAFDASLREVTNNKTRGTRMLASLFVFLPSVSFWSSGLGKDSISFFAVGLALWASLGMRRRWWLLVISIIAMLLVRPHMAGILGLGLAGSFVLQQRVPMVQRLLFGGLAAASAVVLVPLGLDYAGVAESSGATDLIEYIEDRQVHNLTGGGAVDIANMNLPMQLFTYLFRPTIVEITDIFSIAAALDNLILLFLFIVGGWNLIMKPLPVHLLAHNRMFLWIYSAITWAVLAMTTANLGIALRQKWMFVPMLVFLLISVMGRPKLQNHSSMDRRIGCQI